jgi:phosphatidylglycerophosphatase A
MLWDELLWTFFGIGKLQPGGGTWAGLVAAVMAAVGYRFGTPAWVWILVAGVFFVGTLWLTPRAEARYATHDPKPLVIDEVCGTLLAVVVVGAATTEWLAAPFVVAGFVLFRVLDIWKPPPVSWMERLPAGWGVGGDDAVAGVMAAVLVNAGYHLYRSFFVS